MARTLSSSRRRHAATIFACLAVLLAVALAGRAPWQVEAVYAGWLGPALVRLLTLVSGRSTSGFAEIVAAAALLVLLLPLLATAVRGRRTPGGARTALADQSLRAASYTAVVVCAFYLLWGLNYARPDLVQRLDWEDATERVAGQEGRIAELSSLAYELVDATNREYLAVVGGPDLGSETTVPGSQLDLDKSIDNGYRSLAHQLQLAPAISASYGPAKPVRLSGLLTRIGISGFYFPWTGEANYNAQMPGYQLPMAIAHEKAHQRGIAGEDEANFFGYLAGAYSEHPYARYSSYLFAQRRLLGELWELDPDKVTELVALRLPGVQRDVDAGREFWQRYQGPASDVQREVNDAYLRAHGVDGGIDSYSRAARLIVLFARVSGGSAVVDPDSTALAR